MNTCMRCKNETPNEKYTYLTASSTVDSSVQGRKTVKTTTTTFNKTEISLCDDCLYALAQEKKKGKVHWTKFIVIQICGLFVSLIAGALFAGKDNGSAGFTVAAIVYIAVTIFNIITRKKDLAAAAEEAKQYEETDIERMAETMRPQLYAKYLNDKQFDVLLDTPLELADEAMVNNTNFHLKP